jgi:hypothetical protein
MLKDTPFTVSVKSFFSLGMTPGGVVVAEELDIFCALELLERTELDEPCRAEEEEIVPEMEEDVPSPSLLYSDAEEISPS